MTIEGRPVLSDFCYKKYTLEHLENWILDSLSCDEVTAQEIYETIIKALNDNIGHHKKELDKNVELLSLLKGHRSVDFDYTETREHYDGWDKGTKKRLVCDRDDTSENCKKQWDEFWEAL